MIELRQGDILAADAEALVNTVNTVGVMGRGIALQFRKAFPENYKAYKLACSRGALEPGAMLVHDLHRLQNPRYIINFPTKRHWRERSRLEYIEEGLEALLEEIRKRTIRSIAIPPLGTGLGGLNWQDVKARIGAAFRDLSDVQVLLYEPVGAPAAEVMVQSQPPPRMTSGRAALLGLMRRYLAAVMDPTVTLLEIHKLMYFMQEAGEKLQLRYTKAVYGPYAENLRHVLSRIEGHFTAGFGDAEDAPDKQIQLIPGASIKAERYLESHTETRTRLERVAKLIEGFESPYGMELLASVHWVITREGASTASETVAKTYEWSPRKRMFSNEHVGVAREVLRDRGWVLAR